MPPRRSDINWRCVHGHEYSKVGVYKNGDCKACKQPKSRKYTRMRNGIKNATSEKKKGPCEICSRDRVLLMDHDHSTGEVRGWVCHRCNIWLSALDDNIWQKKALKYLHKYSKSNKPRTVETNE